jgi:hypothetical protein
MSNNKTTDISKNRFKTVGFGKTALIQGLLRNETLLNLRK